MKSSRVSCALMSMLVLSLFLGVAQAATVPPVYEKVALISVSEADAGGALELGLFGSQVMVVRLPASAILLGSALFASFVIGRRRRGAAT